MADQDDSSAPATFLQGVKKGVTASVTGAARGAARLANAAASAGRQAGIALAPAPGEDNSNFPQD
jgi:hypothetical protein